MSSENRMEITLLGHKILTRLPAEINEIQNFEKYHREHTKQSFMLTAPTKFNFYKLIVPLKKIKKPNMNNTCKSWHEPIDLEEKKKLKLNHIRWKQLQEKSFENISRRYKENKKQKQSDYDALKQNLHQKSNNILCEWDIMLKLKSERAKKILTRIRSKKYPKFQVVH